MSEEIDAASDADRLIANRAEPAVAAEGTGQMLDVRIPHVHAPHGEIGGWRGFVTHIAVIAIGLLLAVGLEQGVEYIHHEVQRARLEAQMRETFQSNIGRAESNIRILNGLQAYLGEWRNAVNSRISGGSYQTPNASDPRNNVYAPPFTLGSYGASKIDGSVSLLGLNRIRLYDRIEFQQNIMLGSWQHFFDSLTEFRAFTERFSQTREYKRGTLTMPNIESLSAAELLEYRVLLGKMIESDRLYASLMANLEVSYRLMLGGVDDLDTLVDAPYKPGLKQ